MRASHAYASYAYASLAAALVAASTAACGGGGHDIQVNGAKVDNVSFAKRDSTKPLGKGDLRIATTDSAIEVALIGDSLVAGFGAATRAKINRDLDTNKVSGSGFGASIEKMVKSTVAGALDHEMHVPLSDISDVKEEDGLLVFYGKDGKRMNFMSRDRDKGKPSRFSDDDARDFIALFKAKTGRA